MTGKYSYGMFHWRFPIAVVATFSLTAYGYLEWSKNFFPKPATYTPENLKFEEDTLNLPGGLHRFHRRIDVNSLNYSVHSHKYWPKWDRRDDDDDNVFHLATLGKLGGSSDEEEDEEEAEE